MKTALTLSLALIAALSAAALAEDQKPAAAPEAPGVGALRLGGGPGQRAQMSPEQQASRLKEELGLDDEQTAKVKAVFEKTAEKFKALREDKSLSEEDRRGKIREMFKSTMDEIGPILTPEQKTKLLEAAAKRKEKGEPK